MVSKTFQKILLLFIRGHRKFPSFLYLYKFWYISFFPAIAANNFESLVAGRLSRPQLETTAKCFLIMKQILKICFNILVRIEQYDRKWFQKKGKTSKRQKTDKNGHNYGSFIFLSSAATLYSPCLAVRHFLTQLKNLIFWAVIQDTRLKNICQDSLNLQAYYLVRWFVSHAKIYWY